MTTAVIKRELGTTIGALTAASIATGAYIALAVQPSMKVLAGVLGALGCLLAAYLSGNIRLFCLWGLMITMDFDLSKRFGPIIAKMGGENSFRVEMSDPFILGLIFFFALDILKGRKPPLVRIPRVMIIWVVLMLLGCWDVAFGDWRLTAAQEVFRMGKVAVLFLVVCNELETPKRVLHCATAMIFGTLIQSIVGLLQYYYHKNFGLQILGETAKGTLKQLAAETETGVKAFRVGAFLSHPNIFGLFLAVMLPIAIGCFLLRLNKAYKLFFLVTTMLGMAALIATLSRSGWVSFATAFCVLLGLMTMHQKLRPRSLLAAGAAAVAVLAVCIAYWGPIMTRIYDSKDSAMISRYEYIKTAWGMIKQKPVFGWGLNSYVFVAPPFTKYGAREAKEVYENWLPPVHNIYLLWWSEQGLVGLLLQLTMWGWIIWIGICNLKVKDELLFTINAACLAGMAAFAVDGMFSFTIRINSIMRLFFVVSGIIYAIHYWHLRHPRLRPRRVRTLLAAGPDWKYQREGMVP